MSFKENTGGIHLTLNGQLFKGCWKDLVNLFKKEEIIYNQVDKSLK